MNYRVVNFSPWRVSRLSQRFQGFGDGPALGARVAAYRLVAAVRAVLEFPGRLIGGASLLD